MKIYKVHCKDITKCCIVKRIVDERKQRGKINMHFIVDQTDFMKGKNRLNIVTIILTTKSNSMLEMCRNIIDDLTNIHYCLEIPQILNSAMSVAPKVLDEIVAYLYWRWNCKWFLLGMVCKECMFFVLMEKGL